LIAKIKLKNIFNFISKDKNQKILKKLNLLLSFICIFFIWNIFTQYKSSFLLKLRIDEGFLVIISYILAGLLWSKYMKDNYQGKLTDYFYNWSFSKIGKFIPTGIVTLTVRLNQKVNKNKNSKEIFYGVLEEQFLFPLVSIPAIGLYLSNNFENQYIYLLPIYFVTFFYIVKFLYSKIRGNKNTLMSYPYLFISYLFSQFLVLYFIAENIGYEDSITIACYYFLSSSLGLFFIGVPAGIGIREAIFLMVTNNFSTDVLLLDYAIKVRLVFIIVDLLFGLIGFLKIYNSKTYE